MSILQAINIDNESEFDDALSFCSLVAKRYKKQLAEELKNSKVSPEAAIFSQLMTEFTKGKIYLLFAKDTSPIWYCILHTKKRDYFPEYDATIIDINAEDGTANRIELIVNILKYIADHRTSYEIEKVIFPVSQQDVDKRYPVLEKIGYKRYGSEFSFG